MNQDRLGDAEVRRTMETTAIGRGRRRQAERRDESERGLVRAAIVVVLEEGVSAATFEEISRRSGLSRGLVGQRFGSKQGLIDAVVAYLQEAREARASELGIDRMRGLEALLTQTNLFLRQLAMKNEGQAYFRLLASAVADNSTLQATFATNHSQARDRLAAWVKRGQAEGDIDPGVDPTAAGLMVGSLMLGASMQILIDPTTDIEAIRTTTLATLKAALSRAST